MISREETVAFIWRCPGCSGVYEGEGLLFLHTDGVHRYCPCGGRLIEDVEPAAERRYRLVIPERLRGRCCTSNWSGARRVRPSRSRSAIGATGTSASSAPTKALLRKVNLPQ